MKRTVILCFAFLLSISLFAEDKAKPIKSTIKEVTVFKKGAQVSRSATAQIPAGSSYIKFVGITPNLDKNSVQVKADGDFMVLSVVHQLNFFESPLKTDEIEKLNKQKAALQLQIEDENTLILVLKDEEQLILSNKIVAGNVNGLQVDQLKAAAELYRTRLKELRIEKLAISRKVKDLQKQIAQIQQQLSELNYRERSNTSEIVLAISSKKSTTGNFTINYLVNSAGWTPHYDLRVQDVNSPVQLSYKANVYQNSGESWEKVQLNLSTGDPTQSGTKPILNPWMLNFYNPYAYSRSNRAGVYSGAYKGNVRQVTGVIMDESGEPLIGASIFIKGTSTGTATDIDGRYTLNVPEYGNTMVISYTGYTSLETAINSNQMNIVLDESGVLLESVVVTGKSRKKRNRRKDNKLDDASADLAPTPAVPVQEIEKATTVFFKIDIPYDVLSDGKQYVVQIKEHELPAYYEYYCAPKIDPDAFLTAQITGWEQYNLLNGETSLFFEGTFLGNAFLDVQSVEDTLDISLGRDKSIIVKRTRKKENTKKKFLSNKRIDTRAWDIEIRNKKKQSINIVIEDQIPVAVTEEIEVEKQIGKAAFEEKTGKLKWKFTLEANKTKKLDFKYTVKYPKKQRVQLE